MIKKVSASDLKADLNKFLKNLNSDENLDLAVTQDTNLPPVAVIMSLKRYRAFRETLELLTPQLDARVKKVEEDHRNGKWMTREEVLEKLGIPLNEKDKEILKKFKDSSRYRRRERQRRKML